MESPKTRLTFHYVHSMASQGKASLNKLNHSTVSTSKANKEAKFLWTPFIELARMVALLRVLECLLQENRLEEA